MLPDTRKRAQRGQCAGEGDREEPAAFVAMHPEVVTVPPQIGEEDAAGNLWT
jgi:hypothetical protein